MEISDWDERYRSEASISAPTPLLFEVASKLETGRALDLACGTGRNAIWLAEQGWNVTAVDGSSVAIEALRRRAPSVDARVADLEKHEFEIGQNSWDLIADCFYLQRDLFEPIKRALAPSGVAVIIVHLADEAHPNSRFSVEPGELVSYFADCEILQSYEGPSRDGAHHRPVAEIVISKR